MRTRMWPVILAVGLVGSLAVGTGIADEGGGGNNLSTPVIFAEGYGLSGMAVDAEDYTTTGFPGLVKCDGVEDWAGADGAPYEVSFDAQGTDPTLYQLVIDGTDYLDPVEGQTTASEGDYYLQPYTLDSDPFGMETCWEADWVDGSGIDDVDINALDVGDSLVRVLRKATPNPIRVEFSLYQDTEVPGTFQDGTLLDGYPMTQLWPPGFSDGKPPSVGSGERQEVWATAAASSAGPTPAELASVYTHNARLMIHKLTWTALPDSFADGNLDGYPSGAIPDTFENGYEQWVEAVEYDGTVGGGEGEAGFSSEVNQGGRALYGYNWGLQSGVDAGWYRITLSIDDEVGGIPANAVITGINPDDLLADDSSGGSDTGNKGFFPPTLVEDPDGNYLFVDVYIAPQDSGGNGKVAGKVTTGGSTALEGKTVTVYDAAGSPAVAMETGADGMFEATMPPGTYHVGVVDPGGQYHAEFYDDRATLADADDVVVVDGGLAYVAVDLGKVGVDPPPGPVDPPVDPGDGHFKDVDAGNIFFADIEWLWQAGITKGCNPPANDEFCPKDSTTRAQIASFFVRALGLTEGGDVDRFVDDDGSVHETDIYGVAASGITRGCNPPANDRFCPADDVLREQMAAFFHRAMVD
jgi:hypothetical protein